MAAFGDVLKFLRKLNGYSQEEVAKVLGVSTPNISRYENGKVTPTEEVIRKTAQFFGVSTDYLLGLTDIPVTESGDIPEYFEIKLDHFKHFKDLKTSWKLRKMAEQLLELADEIEKFE
ncbi:MAG TPA: XRE family transcriptional regulator [Thermotogaceae bacterium]|nr:helix-turn-helix transcriptional regulator [Thermotogota bacterium]HEW91791.1 XRE family transcriptional regulator [Thermotogaceae bacterium]